MGVRNFIKNVKGSPLWKRTTAGALVLLMLVTLIPAGISLTRAADNQDLQDFIVNSFLSGEGNPDHGATWTIIKEGVTYRLSLQFNEGGNLQFDKTNDIVLYYKLPEGVTANNQSTDQFDITISSGGQQYVLHNNHFEVDQATNTVKFTFHKDNDDEAYAALKANSNTQLWLSFDVTFDKDKAGDELDFGNKIKKTVEIDDTQDVEMSQKTCTYKDGRLYYTMTIKSDGINNNITVDDTLSYPDYARIDLDSITAVSSNGAVFTKNDALSNASYFTGTIDKMQHGETVTISYYADIDSSMVGSDGLFPSDRTENTATVTADPDEYPYNNTKTARTYDTIRLMSLQKQGTVTTKAADNTVDLGKAIVTWTVTLNPECKVPLTSNENLTDTLGSGEMEFADAPVSVTFYDKDGNEVTALSNNNLTSGTSNGQYSISGDTLTYNIPTAAYNQKYKVVLTYQTTVDTADYVANKNVDNTTNYRDISTTASVTVEPGEVLDYTVGKDGVLSADKQSISWTVEVQVPEKGFSKNFKIVDTVPNIWDGTANRNIYELYADMAKTDVTVTGLDAGESFDFTKNMSNGTFELDFYYTKEGVLREGLGEHIGGRTLTITYTTPVSEDYVALTSVYSYAYNHTNNVVVTANDTPKSASKTIKVTPDTNLDKAGSFVGTYVYNGNTYPIYKYVLTVTAPSEDDAVIEDAFPEGFILLTNELKNTYGIGTGEAPTLKGGDQYYKGVDCTVTAAETATTPNHEYQFILHFNKDGDNYCPLYDLTYYAILEDESAYKALVSKALKEDDYSYSLQNTATMHILTTDYPADATVTYTADRSKAVAKGIENLEDISAANRDVEYKITINPLELDLKSGTDELTLTDTFSESLSIDYSSIQFSPSTAVVQYDVKGHTLTATIKDEKAITLTYRAKVIGYQDVRFYNTVDVEGHTATSDETKTFNAGESGYGISSDLDIRIVKYENGDMNKKISGVKFQLFYYDTDEPVLGYNNTPVIVETGADGFAKFQGNRNTDGWELEADKKYYFVETYAPSPYQKSDIHYQFTIARDGVANYKEFIYYNDDIMTVKNNVQETQTGQIKVTKTIAGDTVGFDPDKVTLTVTVTDDTSSTGTTTHTRTLSSIADSVTTDSTHCSVSADGKTYTWIIDGLKYGTTATVSETVVNTDGYEVTKTYKVNDAANYEDYQPTSVMIGATEQTVSLMNTYHKIESGKITVTKEYTYSTIKARDFYIGLFTSTDGGTTYVPYKRNDEPLIQKVSFAYPVLHQEIGYTPTTQKEVSFEDLPYNTYYVFEVDQNGNRLTSDASLEYELTNGNGTSVNVEDNTEKSVTIVNTEKKGSLVITKQVVSNGLTKLQPEDYEGNISLRFVGGTTAYSHTYSLREIRANDGQSITNDGTNGTDDDDTIYRFRVIENNGILTYEWRIDNLPSGQYTTNEILTSLGNYTLKTQQYSIDGGSLTTFDNSNNPESTISANGDSTIAYTNTYEEDTGSLKVEKRINGTPSEDETFCFVVTLKDRTDHYVTGTKTFGGKQYTFNTNGQTVIYVTGGSSTTITGIPTGYTYTVEEQIDASGYPAIKDAPGYNKHYEYDTAYNTTGTIAKDDTKTAVAWNTYYELGTLRVMKNVESDPANPAGTAIPTTDPFEIYIVLKDVNGVVVPNVTYPIVYHTNDGEATEATVTFNDSGKATIQLKHTEYAEIRDLEIGYQYEVTEKTYTYDTTTSSESWLVQDSQYGYKNNGIVDNDGVTTDGEGTFADNSTSEVTVNNLYKEKPTAFTITKEITAPDNWTGSIPDDVYYRIKVTFTDSTKLPAVGLHTSINIEHIDGKAVGYLALKAGETAAVTGIPDGAAYKVEEIGYKIGAASKKEVADNLEEEDYWTNTMLSYNSASDTLANATATGIVKDETSGTNITIGGVRTDVGITGEVTDATASVVVHNSYMPSLIYINKIDANDNSATPATLAGARLAVYDGESNLRVFAKDYAGHNVTWVTGENGETEHPIRGLVADGKHKYILSELTPPDGYLPFEDITFVITPDNQIQIKNGGGTHTAISDHSGSTNTSDLLTVKDSQTSFKIQKLANYLGDAVNQPLADAKLSIHKVNGSDVGEQVTLSSLTQPWTTTTAAQEITGLPIGEYYLVEDVAPDGYYKADPIRFTLNSENQILVDGEPVPVVGGVSLLTMTDQRKNKIKIRKVGDDGTTRLGNAELEILDSLYVDASGQEHKHVAEYKGVPMTWSSSATVDQEFEIAPGRYYLRETSAPDGYFLSTKVYQFNVGDNGAINFDGIYSYDRADTIDDPETILQVKNSVTKTYIKKVDTAGVAVPDATLALYTVDANNQETPVHLESVGGKLYVTSITTGTATSWQSTGTDPVIIYGLSIGQKYALRESAAPSGYIRSTEPVYFELNEYGNLTNVSPAANNVNNELRMVNQDNKLNFTKRGLINESCIADLTKRNDTVALDNITFKAVKTKELNGDAYTSTLVEATAVSQNGGYVKFEALPTGIYEVTETGTVDPYVLNTTKYYAKIEDATIFEGLYTDDSFTTKLADNCVINDQVRTNLEFTKVDESDSTKKLKDAKYGLFCEDDTHTLVKIAEAVSDANGKVTFEGVVTGKAYTIKELEAPFGYYLTTEQVVIKYNDDAGLASFDEASFDNANQTMKYDSGALTWLEKKKVLKINKVDEDGVTPKSGAEMCIQDLNGQIVKIGGQEQKWTSNGTAHDITMLPTGTYKLVETKAPDDYQIANPIIFTYQSDGSVSVNNTVVPVGADGAVSLTMVNRPYREIYVSKVDATTERELPGAHIQILDLNENVVVINGTPLEWTSTAAEPEHRVLITPGSYILRETVAPDGYTVRTDTRFNVAEDGTVNNTGIPDDQKTRVRTSTLSGKPLLLVDDSMTQVSINKVDITGDQPIAGATLRLLDENGSPVRFDDDGYVVENGGYTEWVSSGNLPKQIKGLTTGKRYTLVETVAPEGYLIATNTSFVLDKYGRIDTSQSNVSVNAQGIILVRDAVTSLNFEKYGKYNEKCIDAPENPNAVMALSGVTFTAKQILDEAGHEVAGAEVLTAKSNENGVVYFEHIARGTYEVRETAALDGYILDDTVYYAKIDSQAFAGLTYDVEGTKAVENNRLINETYYADIAFSKVSEINHDKKLAGSTYGLFKKKKDGELTRIATAVTDEDGVIKFSGVFINTEYVIQELYSPDGYYVSKNPITLGFKLENNEVVFDTSLFNSGNGTVVISADGSLTWLEPEVVVDFTKLDEDGKPLAGAKLKVLDEQGEVVVDTWTSSVRANRVSGVFVVGETYQLVEVEAPNGYEVAAPVVFTIDDSTVANGENKIITVTMTDKKVMSPQQKEAPKTGDRTPLQLAVLLGMISLFVMLILLDRKLFAKNK